MKCDKLTPVTREYADEYWKDRFAMVYNADEVDAAIDELKEELNRAKVREDVLVTDNRNLLEKVQVLENLVRENAEHFKRNESQILENAEKELRHHKYKRCLAMAESCKEKAILADMLSPKRTSRKFVCWKARYEKWLELADKFKE